MLIIGVIVHGRMDGADPCIHVILFQIDLRQDQVQCAGAACGGLRSLFPIGAVTGVQPCAVCDASAGCAGAGGVAALENQPRRCVVLLPNLRIYFAHCDGCILCNSLQQGD